ncbi:UDP-2,3-diacylglucosamine diphosphatase [Methylovulum miyakonense]|uniref:UDP-2,3-diacylglucosamine diphosphatase n=1 Tax=Methylovulum miyakonense TaxID=645578 RepID=UPI000382B3B5|nr:UDP-2,3-diacylglucosamine diphosphatase [Methylovulum miyakonense]
MPKDILFISDLHLSLDKPEITRRFLDFLRNRAPQASALYILGDLFDAWIGDDDYTPPNRVIRQQLKQLANTGTQVYLQPGNRDFLLGKRFCQETGVTLLDDYAVVDLFGTPTLLTHGDLLCTDDLPYQAFRNKSRTPEWQNNVLSKPLLIRLLAARWYRLRSFFHKRNKSQEIMDVNQGTVINAMRGHGCFRLIHGHTHRPAIHNFELDGKTAQRFVLAAWHKQAGDVLCWNQGACRSEVI